MKLIELPKAILCTQNGMSRSEVMLFNYLFFVDNLKFSFGLKVCYTFFVIVIFIDVLIYF
jgi:hypothetical protein